MTPQRYPLTWPAGWKRTPTLQRQRAQFGKVEYTAGGAREYAGKSALSVEDAIARLQAELERLGVKDELLSTNRRLGLDGRPRAGAAESDPGAAVYFRIDGVPGLSAEQQTCLACDRWDRLADNIAAIAMHIRALRAIERYGIGTLAQAFRGYVALAPTEYDWRLVLGVKETATLADGMGEVALRCMTPLALMASLCCASSLSYAQNAPASTSMTLLRSAAAARPDVAIVSVLLDPPL